ncbi:ferritin-like domain-containing protein [uncultured Hymenobacter sp.]|uniref:ferritin-like domain-containing protein n=1 Tax=uncultured Hymenobacter sp. TaxID=170016 RepID=UPI0035CAC9B9
MTDLPSSSESAPAAGAVPRRDFLRVAGASAVTVGLVLAGCGKDEPTPDTTTPTVLSFGNDQSTGDMRVLNYLFFIKQLEFAFYDKAIGAFPADVTAPEQTYFRDLRDHELVQRQVLGNVLGANALAPLPFDFASVTLNTRAGVLDAAKLLEDTGAQAFLGVLPLLNSNTLFTLAAKMASAEARHAALMRDVQTPGSFVGDDVVETTGLQAGQAKALTPAEVAVILKPFLPTLTINTDSLPTT